MDTPPESLSTIVYTETINPCIDASEPRFSGLARTLPSSYHPVSECLHAVLVIVSNSTTEIIHRRVDAFLGERANPAFLCMWLIYVISLLCDQSCKRPPASPQSLCWDVNSGDTGLSLPHLILLPLASFVSLNTPGSACDMHIQIFYTNICYKILRGCVL